MSGVLEGEEVVAAVDLVALLVNHQRFAPLQALAHGKAVIDTRGMRR
jgi:hypothetical protein